MKYFQQFSQNELMMRLQTIRKRSLDDLKHSRWVLATILLFLSHFIDITYTSILEEVSLCVNEWLVWNVEFMKWVSINIISMEGEGRSDSISIESLE